MTLAFLQCPIRLASSFFAYMVLATLVGPVHAETTTRLDAIVGSGALRVGLTEDYRPFSFADASGKIEGIDVDMAMSLAQSLGVRLEIVKTSWSTLRSDLETNSFDIAMGGITITLDRQKIGLFSNALTAERAGVVCATSRPRSCPRFFTSAVLGPRRSARCWRREPPSD